eukprot:TRINITY_DN2965_c0_g1_i1.p1 TRINITY_DN2965_c0_g1~~TRINITY_DN2965_c0_g1_i1.p1  ORF type:complete len:399 (-),score=100.09 TRINITY_DN2965_c0_g1_i1:285-1481(-)
MVGFRVKKPAVDIIILCYNSTTKIYEDLKNFVEGIVNHLNEQCIDVYVNTEYDDKPIDKSSLKFVINNSLLNYIVIIGDKNLRNNSISGRINGRLIEMSVEKYCYYIVKTWNQNFSLLNQKPLDLNKLFKMFTFLGLKNSKLLPKKMKIFLKSQDFFQTRNRSISNINSGSTNVNTNISTISRYTVSNTQLLKEIRLILNFVQNLIPIDDSDSDTVTDRGLRIRDINQYFDKDFYNFILKFSFKAKIVEELSALEKDLNVVIDQLERVNNLVNSTLSSPDEKQNFTKMYDSEKEDVSDEYKAVGTHLSVFETVSSTPKPSVTNNSDSKINESYLPPSIDDIFDNRPRSLSENINFGAYNFGNLSYESEAHSLFSDDFQISQMFSSLNPFDESHNPFKI